MAPKTTAEQRVLWAPACRTNIKQGVREAWVARDHCFKVYRYEPREGVTGARSCRRITGGTGFSLHAYFIDGIFTHWNGLQVGMAIAEDVNWDRNPYGARLVTDRPREMVEDILAIRTNNSEQVWGWGGNYSRNKDAMHDELVCGPADLATGIDFSTVRLWAPPGVEVTVPPGVDADRKWPGNPSARFGAYNREEFSGRFDGNVEYIQRLLNKTNLDLKTLLKDPRIESKLRVDGFYGLKSEKAVSGFQGAQQLRMDGKVGRITWDRLNQVT